MGKKKPEAFGLWELSSEDGEKPMPSKINALLKPYGLRLKIQRSREWGDQVKVTVQDIADSRLVGSPDGIFVLARTAQEEKDLQAFFRKTRHIHYSVKGLLKEPDARFKRLWLAPSIIDWKEGKRPRKAKAKKRKR